MTSTTIPPLPRFVSATDKEQYIAINNATSNNKNANSTMTDENNVEQQISDDATSMFSTLMNGDADFDLLAEFLLDEGDGVSAATCSNVPTATAAISTVSVTNSDSDDFSPSVAAAAAHADPLADAAATAATKGDSAINAAVNILNQDLLEIESLFSTQQKNNTLKPNSVKSSTTISNSKVTASDGNKGKRKYAHTASTTQPNIPLATQSGNAVTSTLNAGNTNAPQRQKSQAQIDRRRERNRILARRTRLRKKFFFESLQKEVTDLQGENIMLKNAIRTHISPPSKASDILIKCKAKNDIPAIVYEHVLGTSEIDKQDVSLIQSLQSSQRSFIITDPSLQDNPIVYASPGFLTLTGYSREDVLGRNCRFLQGRDSCPQKIEKLKKAITFGDDIGVCLANYKADGTPFWNQIFIAALRDAHNNIVNFVGVLSKVSGPSPDDPEYGKVLTKNSQEAVAAATAASSVSQMPKDFDVDKMVQIAVEAADAVQSRQSS